MFAGPPVAAVLVNIFGGITRCEDVARGLVEAITAAGVDAPVVVRLDGNAAEEGHAVLRGRGPPQRDASRWTPTRPSGWWSTSRARALGPPPRPRRRSPALGRRGREA